MAVLESDIRSLFKVITSETMKTVKAGQKTILSPTTVRNLASEISAQAGFVSVVVGAGAAWFGLYVNGKSSKVQKSKEPLR